MSSFNSSGYNFGDPNYSYTTTVSNTDYSYDTPAETPKRKFPLLLLIAIGGILLVVLLFILFFNKPASNNTNNNNNNTNSGKVELIWWGVFLDQSVVQPLIDQYQTENPNVTIKYANRWPNTDYNTASDIYRNELNALIAKRDSVSMPDIFMVRNSWAGDYFTYTSPSPVNNLAQVQKDFYPAVSTDFAKSNAVYGLPLWMDTLGLVYNENILEKTTVTIPPTKWVPEFFNLSQRVYQVTNGQTAGFSAGFNSNVSYGVELYYLLMLQSGVKIVEAPTGTGTTYTASFASGDNASGALESLQFFKNFVGPSGGGWTDEYKNDAAAFLEQDVAMITATSWRLRQILFYNDFYDLGLDIKVVQVPQFSDQTEPLMNWADYWGNMVSNNRPAQNVKASWDFLNWITKPEQLRKLSDNEKQKNNYFGFLYPRVDMNSDYADHQYLKVYNQSLPFAKSFFMGKGDLVRKAFAELLDSSSPNESKIKSTQDNVQNILNTAGIIQ